MKKIIFVIIIMIPFIGNSQILDIVGIYDYDDGFHEFKLFVNSDSTFEIINMIPDTVNGRWNLVNDSLFVETFLQESIIEKFDKNRNDKIIRVRDNYGFCKQTIILINDRSVIKITDKQGDLIIDIDTIKSIKVLEGEYPIFNISNYNANDITLYFHDHTNGPFLPKIFKQCWLVENELIYAWITKEGTIEKNRFFKKVNERQMKYYKKNK